MTAAGGSTSPLTLHEIGDIDLDEQNRKWSAIEAVHVPTISVHQAIRKQLTATKLINNLCVAEYEHSF